MKSQFETLESRTLMSASSFAATLASHTEVPASAIQIAAEPVISSQQKANLQKLASDLKNIHAASDVTTAQKQALVADLTAIVQVATKPSPASVQKLVTDFQKAAADKKFTAAEKLELTADFDAVLTSANIPVSLVTAVNTDMKAIVISSNVTSADVQLIVGDLQAIVAGFKV